MSPFGPERRLLPAPTWSRLRAKQTPLEVARMTRLTHSDRLLLGFGAAQHGRYAAKRGNRAQAARPIDIP